MALLKHIRTVFIILLQLFLILSVEGQTFPIQVNTSIAPPYSLRLSDYVESGYERVQVTINPRDMNLTAYRVKLKLVIESFNGQIRIETSPGYLPPPIFLDGGAPVFLTSYDIQDLFKVENLIFTGLSKNEYNRTKKLPEGFYRIGFEALDYNRASSGNELRVSNFGFAMAGLFLNDPPILNLPLDDNKLMVYEPQNIVFQWMPRHKGSPNSAFSANYIFRLYEVWNANTDPNLIASTQLPIFETEVNSSRLVYGIAEPVLIPGKKYVWRVRLLKIRGATCSEITV